MLGPQQIEELIRLVTGMEREVLIENCTRFRGRFPVDFTPQFLSTLTTDRVRHIYVAMCMQSGIVPTLGTATAA